MPAPEEESSVLRALFTKDEAARLTSTTARTVARWASDGFIPAPINGEFFEFRGLVALRVLAELRQKHRLSRQLLSRAASYLTEYAGTDVWARLEIYTDGRRLCVRNPATGLIEDIVTKQIVAEPPAEFGLQRVGQKLQEAVRADRRRPSESRGVITRRFGVRSSEPCFDGTRIPVAMVVRMLRSGTDARTILNGYPTLSKEDIEAARIFDPSAKLPVLRSA